MGGGASQVWETMVRLQLASTGQDGAGQHGCGGWRGGQTAVVRKLTEDGRMRRRHDLWAGRVSSVCAGRGGDAPSAMVGVASMSSGVAAAGQGLPVGSVRLGYFCGGSSTRSGLRGPGEGRLWVGMGIWDPAYVRVPLRGARWWRTGSGRASRGSRTGSWSGVCGQEGRECRHGCRHGIRRT